MINNKKIYVPQILIPKWINIPVEANIGLHGEIEWELIETKRFSKPVVVRRGKQHNVIVDAGIFNLLQYANDISTMCAYFAVGTGTSTPSTTQTALDIEIARKAVVSSSGYNGPPPYLERKYVFQENEANGDLTEWGTFQYSSGAPMFSRELFRDELTNPVVVTKTNTQVLNITYRVYVRRLVDSTSVSKTVGATTYTCITTINDKQLYNMSTRSFFGSLNLSYVRTGTSNAASDLVGDAHDTIKGTVLFSGSPLQDPSKTYVSGSKQITVTINLASSESNGQIGEILIPFYYNLAYGARVTFNPTITKDSTKKLQLSVLFTFGDM